MKIVKVLNNNAVLVVAPNRQKIVAIGKGLAFGKHPGDIIMLDDSHIKLYKHEKEGLIRKLSKLLEEIPIEHIKIANEIISQARKHLGYVDERIFLTLIDHLSFAIERHEQGIEFHDTLWEIQSLYPREFEAARISTAIIKNRLNVELPESEVSFFAFHFVNANADNLSKARDSMVLIQGVLDIINHEFNQTIEQSDPKYSRFMTHLKYFSGMILNSPNDSKSLDVEPNSTGTIPLMDYMLMNLGPEKKVASKVEKFVKAQYNYDMSVDDKNYLILHLKQIVKEG